MGENQNVTNAIHLSPRRWRRLLLAISLGLLLCVGTSRCLLAQADEPARVMSVHDILYLNKYGEGISGVSWCNDQTFTFVTHGPVRNTPSVFEPEYSRGTTVSMFTIETQQIRPIVLSDSAAFAADCVRNGQYVFLSGSLRSAISKDAKYATQVSFSEFIDTRAVTSLRDGTLAVEMPLDLFLKSPVRTASDGSIYARGSSSALDLDSVIPSRRASIVEKRLTYGLSRGGARAVSGTAGLNRPEPERFQVNGLSAPEVWGIGSYDCSASRPGCAADSSSPRVGYYLYSKINTDRARRDVAFTFTPGRRPSLKRWPVVGRPGMNWNTLLISGLALDAKHCYVLLEPRPELAVNRINGRLRLDLYLAQCRFAENQIEFDEPRPVGRKQGSFIWPTLDLHGEFAVITESLDFPSQVDDQIELERTVIGQPNVCARFYRTGTWPVAPVNTICVRLIQNGPNGLKVSPNGRYVDIPSKSDPLIVGREYRNNGAGPAWLNHGEQP